MPWCAMGSTAAPTPGSNCNGISSARVFLLGAGYTLKMNEHIRIDIINSRLSQRGRNMVELFAISCF